MSTIEFSFFSYPDADIFHFNSSESFVAPSFKTKLSDRSINDGDQLRLTLEIEGDPEPKIEWFKDGHKLQSSDIIDLKYRNGTATLTIAEAFPEDEGRYECVATNSEGRATNKCFITIKRKLQDLRS